jgi:DNA-binding IclR family transcriptional regulator
MPSSKLDKYLDILEVVAEQPQKIDHIAAKVHMEKSELKRRMNFLVLNGVVNERLIDDNLVVYALNDRGYAVFRTLRAFKYFEKLRESLPVIEEAKEIASILSKNSRKLRKE